VLVVGAATAPRPSSVVDIYVARSLREALATIRLVSFDLIVAGLDDPTIDVWALMQRVSSAWPQQRWVLASPAISAEEEVLARSLGAVMVLSAAPDVEWIAECAASLRRAGASRPSAASVLPGMPATIPSALASARAS
jgi:DNA-binding response OmpR family regulator